MRQNLTKLYEGANLSGATPGVIYLPILEAGTLKAVDVKSDENVASADAVFSLNLNGTPVTGAGGITIAIGEKIGSVTGLDVALAKDDELVLDLVSGAPPAPIALNAGVDSLVEASQADIYEAVKDVIQAGSNATVTPNDGAKTLSIAASPGGGSGGAYGADVVPSSPGAFDYEFDAEALPSYWAPILGETLSSPELNTRVKSAHVGKLATGGKYRLEADFAPAGDFSLTLAGWCNATANYGGMDIFIRDGGDTVSNPQAGTPAFSDNDYWFALNWSSGLVAETHRRVSGGSRQYQVGALPMTSHHMVSTGKFYLHAQRVGSVWTFAVSNTGVNWVIALSSSDHNFSPTKALITFRAPDALPGYGGFDWVRSEWLYL